MRVSLARCEPEVVMDASPFSRDLVDRGIRASGPHRKIVADAASSSGAASPGGVAVIDVLAVARRNIALPKGRRGRPRAAQAVPRECCVRRVDMIETLCFLCQRSCCYASKPQRGASSRRGAAPGTKGRAPKEAKRDVGPMNQGSGTVW